MNHKIISVTLSAAFLLSLPFAEAKTVYFPPIGFHKQQIEAVKSNNRGAYQYKWEYHALPVKSHLYGEGDKLVRVEYIDGKIVIENYGADFRLLSSRTVSPELPLWGGFFAGSNYNFIIVGQNNPNEDNHAEVIRIIKYDKSWNRLGASSLRGANTIEPFGAGSLRCAEENGILYIHTAHLMYKTKDGLNHQANMTIALRESDMAITDSQYEVTYKYGYVSHSFNQFLIIDNNKYIVTLDHGDAYPRAAIIQRYHKKAGNTSFAGQPSKAEFRKFPQNAAFYNKTGATLGGLAETSNDYIAVYSDDENGGKDKRAANIFFTMISKSKFSEVGARTVKCTNYDKNGDISVGTPFIISEGLGGGYILWDVLKKNSRGDFVPSGYLSYAHYSSNGNFSKVFVANGMVSDCQPIIYNGKATWYVTENSAPTFYTLDSGGLTARNDNTK